MDIFAVLNLIGGLALFLYGMDQMGVCLKRQAGGQLQTILGKLTTNKYKGFLLGLITTAVIQSSSATTVMVIGFINSGIMNLVQACGVIMGANVGTTVTAWLLSTTAIDGVGIVLKLLKPTSFTPVLALIGIIMHMFGKKEKSKNIGGILLGFAVLMFGMDAMGNAVEHLADDPAFRQLFVKFSNPILGLLVGLGLTAIIQSSSAAVGILQALSLTGIVTYSSAIPILMGMNIGTCVDAMLASIGANRDAKRAAYLHLFFNVIGAAIILGGYLILNAIFNFGFANNSVDPIIIAIMHTSFKAINSGILLPLSDWLIKLTYMIVPETADPEAIEVLDERLLATSSVATEQSRRVTLDMAATAKDALLSALKLVDHYDAKQAEAVQKQEDRLDRYEDMLGTYLVKLSAQQLSESDSVEVSQLLHMIGDFERIGDHALNLSEVGQELYDKKLRFSESAQREVNVLTAAIQEILELAITAFETGDLAMARKVEPLEQVVDDITKVLKTSHISRLQNGDCTIEMGFILSDFTGNCERVADHCSNIAATLIENAQGDFDLHGYTGHVAENVSFRTAYDEYRQKYSLT